MEDLISIVVPIYNVEKYLNRCVDSILGQTYRNIEIILVDDGSPDGCAKICDEYSLKDNRIKVIHKKNGGLSDARNKGIELAKGVYISFVDADDLIAPYFIEILYNMCIKYSCDISMGYFQQFETKISFSTECDKEIKAFSNIEMVKNLCNDMYLQSVVVWNKLYKTTLFQNINYPFGKIYEDEATTYKLYYAANKIVVTTQILYGYSYRQGSITKSCFSIKNLDFIGIAKERAEFYKDNDEMELYIQFLRLYCYTLISFYNKIRIEMNEEKRIPKELFNEYKIQYKYMVKSPLTSKKQKLGLTLLRINPKLLNLLLKARGYIK